MKSGDDLTYMNMALDLAARGRGLTTPNPMVGAVVVKRGQIVGNGYHRRAGGAHAEIEALARAGKDAKGATLYVTLEPCCHLGLTGPCTEKIIDAGIARVVYADKDPDPRVNGRGARVLKTAGVRVTSGVCAQEARQLNEVHYHFHRTGRPLVVVKFAQSLDGRVATNNGDSRWISSPESLRLAHQLRAESCAVVVGSGTVIADDPTLTVRRVKGAQPFRIIMSSSLPFHRRFKLLRPGGDAATIVATTEAAIRRVTRSRWWEGVAFLTVKSNGAGKLDIRDFIRSAAKAGLKSLLVEGGPTLATSFINSGCVDKLVVILSPTIIGEGKNSIGDLRIRQVSQSLRLDSVDVRSCGRDLVITGYPVRRRA